MVCSVGSFRQGMFFEAACFNGVGCCVLACPTSGHGTRAGGCAADPHPDCGVPPILEKADPFRCCLLLGGFALGRLFGVVLRDADSTLRDC